MINLVWLKTFCTLVDVGHFTKTAEQLFMTQSGVSQQVKKLEQQLKTTLLIREGKTFSLTEAGLKLYQQGQHLLGRCAEIEKSLLLDDPYIGAVKMASPGSIGLKLYPHLLNLQQQYNALAIDYRFAPNKSIEQDLLARQLDLAIVTEQISAENISSEKIAEEPLVLVTANKIKTITWSTLTTLGFIGHPDAPHHAGALLSKNFAEFEHVKQFKAQGFCNQISLILEPVSRGLGFTVLPLHAAKAFAKPEQIRWHQLPQAVHENLYLCQNRLAFTSKRKQFVKSAIMDFIT
ncbi:transcriptional regulator, LysR family [Colwellia chukchiensis]|uniref:Transcriptional regulator, LysR family n=1 Tax=Colwellia chukchiensis TaxID=641665 RepID=A0A1H7SW25_9GAMM|nr:LysR family transcriptional regulator [Colwellia chukchiensis]SEL76781.1 transcriptional regulator, LysR family [Colwellia chukchiensis]